MPDYKKIALESRKKVLELVYRAGTSHIGSLFSCADILAVLFEKIDLDQDRFVLSAGWKAAMLYYHLWRKGKITEDELNSYCQEGSKFIGLAEPIIPEIPIAGGSMGLGLPGAIGIALAKKLKADAGKVYVLMSDGELQCGTLWESLLITGKHELKNLCVIVDYNGFQALGKTKDILEPPLDFFEFFDNYRYIDGHNFEEIELALERGIYDGYSGPRIIIAKTIKGKGVSFMENNNLWHYAQIKEDDYAKALKELCQNS